MGVNFDVLILEMKVEDFEFNEDGNDKEEIKDGLLNEINDYVDDFMFFIEVDNIVFENIFFGENEDTRIILRKDD